MVPESIKKRREVVFSECRRLLIKINGDIAEKSYRPESLEDSSVHGDEDTGWVYNVCDCCGRNDVANDEMTQIESGQRICPGCLDAFYEALEKRATQG